MTKMNLSAFRRALESRQAELGNGTRNREALTIETSADELDRIQDASDRDYAMRSLARLQRVARSEYRSSPHRRWDVWNLRGLPDGNQSEAPGCHSMGLIVYCLPRCCRSRTANARERNVAGWGGLSPVPKGFVRARTIVEKNGCSL